MLLLLLLAADTWAAWKMNVKPVNKILRQFAGAALPLMITTIAVPHHASAAPYPTTLNNMYVDKGGKFSFGYTKEFVLSPKPLQTHQVEVYFKSEETKGFSLGLTVSHE